MHQRHGQNTIQNLLTGRIHGNSKPYLMILKKKQSLFNSDSDEKSAKCLTKILNL